MDATATFSLSCFGCDAGIEYVCREEAVLSGWSRVMDDPDGLAWTALGLCPDCREERLAEGYE